MKNVYLILTLLFFFRTAYAQKPNIIEWDKIIITDREPGWEDTNPQTFEITKDSDGIPTLHFKGKEVKKVDLKLIENLCIALNTNLYDPIDPFKMFHRDSSCIDRELKPLWELYFRDVSDGDQKINSYALQCLNNYKLVKPQVINQTGDEWFDDTPIMSIEFIHNNESVKFTSKGEHAYMLPWESENKEIYNSKISILLSQILPAQASHNEDLLKGYYFSMDLFDEIYLTHIDTFMLNTMFENKFNNAAKKLSSQFKILYAIETQRTTIDWGKDLALNCVMLDLKHPSMA